MSLEKQYAKYYSCKRKKDFVTTGAVVMFLCIVLFELYLMFVLPVQLSQENAMRREVSRDQVVKQLDIIREKIKFYMHENKGHKGEVALIGGAMDILALYLREEQDHVSDEQIAELKNYLDRADAIVNAWGGGNFKIRQEAFDPGLMVQSLEKKLGIGRTLPKASGGK